MEQPKLVILEEMASIYIIYTKKKNQILATFLARAFDIVFSDSYIYNDLHINPFSY